MAAHHTELMDYCKFWSWFGCRVHSFLYILPKGSILTSYHPLLQRWNTTLSETLQFRALTLRQSIAREQRWVSIEHVPIRWIKRCTWAQLTLTVPHFWIWPLARLPSVGWKGVVAQTTSLLDAFSTGDTAGSPCRPQGISAMNYKYNIVLCLYVCK